MKASFPQANDELYANLKWQPEGIFHVLATAWDDHSLYKPGEKQPIPGPGLNQPMLWTSELRPRAASSSRPWVTIPTP